MTDGSTLQFSVVGFIVAVVAIGIGTAAGLAFVPVAGSYVGMVVGGLVAGLAVEKRPLIESGIAAVLANLGILFTGGMLGTGALGGLSALGSISLPALAVSILLSFAVGGFGGHFGHDIRDGLTEPVESSPSGSSGMGPTAPPVDEDESEAVTERVDTTESRDTEPKPDRETDTSVEDSRELELERE